MYSTVELCPGGYPQYANPVLAITLITPTNIHHGKQSRRYMSIEHYKTNQFGHMAYKIVLRVERDSAELFTSYIHTLRKLHIGKRGAALLMKIAS